MKLYTIRDKNLLLDGGAMFSVVPKVLWQKQYPADENNLCNWAMRCLLADDGKRRILVDNGTGDKQDEKFFQIYKLNGQHSIEGDLKKNGYANEDITDVILTHLHFDHCGGSVKYNSDRTKLELTYPNATYWVSKKQWDCTLDANSREKASFLVENIMPIKESGQMKLVEEEDVEIYPGVRLVQYHGHTIGQIIPYIKCQNRTVAFMGDLLPSTVHIPMSWLSSYDLRPLVALEDKKRFFKDAIEGDFILFFEHDIYNECCTLHETEKGVRCKETFTLKDIFG